MNASSEIHIYTDGSCSPNPGMGGWASLLLFEGQEPKVLQGNASETTNNRMELTAPIEALKSLEDGCNVVICTDSTYVKDGVTKWVPKWVDRGWQTIDGEDVKNQDLWQKLIKETNRHEVSWLWVKGHAEDQYNILVDQLAVEARGKSILPKMDENSIHIYLGVTCKHSTKTGAWASILVYRNHYKYLAERKVDVTANTLYLEAVIQSLLALKKPIPVVFYTSSGYVKEGATSWLPGWRRRGWQTIDGKDVINREQWQKLDELQKTNRVTYQLVDKSNAPCHLQEAKEIAKEVELEEGATIDGSDV